jgi:uncharacterized protein
MDLELEKAKIMAGNKDEIIKVISRIREEIGHEDVKPDILEVISNKEKDEILILTSDRPDKSVVIGKGGWVVGRLREELEVNQIHVEAYPDILLRKYRMKLAYKRMEEIMPGFKDKKSYRPLLNLLHLLKRRIDNPYNLTEIIDDLNKNKSENKPLKSNFDKPKFNKSPDAVVALSGGLDSSSSLIIADMLGFNPTAVTVNPGDIILPRYFRENVEKLTERLSIKHQYLEVDMSPVVKGALEGRFHPCGKCSKIIEETILDFTRESEIPFLIYGDLLSTGAQSLIFQENILRINLPALLSLSKGEVKALAGSYHVKKIRVNGCPLLGEVHKKHPYMRRFSIQRILRETRAGILEPGEALEMIRGSFENFKYPIDYQENSD